MLPKLWIEIEIDLKETKSAKVFKQIVINIYVENYQRFICEKTLVVYHVSRFHIKKLKKT